jgi:DNA-binding beta-propeller fold protein YncE
MRSAPGATAVSKQAEGICNATRGAFVQRCRLAWLAALCVGAAIQTAAAQYLETTIRVTGWPEDLVWNQANDHLYVGNEEDTLTVVDGATNEIVKRIHVAYYSSELCLNPTVGKVYNTSGDSDTLNVIDALGDSLMSGKRIRGYPQFMAFNTLLNKLYVLCSDDGLVRVFDGSGDTLVAEVGFGGQSYPYRLLWHPGANRVFCVTGSDAPIDTVFVIDCSSDSVVATTPVGQRYSNMCWDPVNDLVYVSSANGVYVLSSAGDSVVAVVPQPSCIYTYICAVPFPNKVYVTRGDWLYVIDGNSNVVADSIAINLGVLACDTRKAKVYGAGRPAAVIDARKDSVLLTMPLTNRVIDEVAWNSTDSRVYMLDGQNGAIYVIRDTTTGVAEPASDPSPKKHADASVCRGGLLHADAPASLFDPTGRRVAALEPGSNDIHGLKLGVYFVKSNDGVLTHKIILQN